MKIELTVCLRQRRKLNQTFGMYKPVRSRVLVSFHHPRDVYICFRNYLIRHTPWLRSHSIKSTVSRMSTFPFSLLHLNRMVDFSDAFRLGKYLRWRIYFPIEFGCEALRVTFVPLLTPEAREKFILIITRLRNQTKYSFNTQFVILD